MSAKLRPIIMSDLQALNRWKNDEEVFKYLGGGFQPVSVDQQSKWMESLIDMSGNNRRFIIEDNDSNAIGMIGLYGINWIHRTCEAGIYIGEAEARGKGYASEAYRMLEKFAAQYLNIRKINIKAVADNTPAVKFWSSNGFVNAGCLHQERFIKGRYCDVLLMEKFI